MIDYLISDQFYHQTSTQAQSLIYFIFERLKRISFFLEIKVCESKMDKYNLRKSII